MPARAMKTPMRRPLDDADFDVHYYTTGCGRPYGRDEHWLAQFERVADGIASRLCPGKTLDAGCAWGLLVESLRRRDVEAYGFDVSSYAIAQVAASVRPYCWRASVDESLQTTYDLIVCIEVFAHLTEDVGRAAVLNFCSHADRVLLSAARYPPHQRHLNDLGPDEWGVVLAEAGFHRDRSEDVTFVTPWAALYRRR